MRLTDTLPRIGDISIENMTALHEARKILGKIPIRGNGPDGVLRTCVFDTLRSEDALERVVVGISAFGMVKEVSEIHFYIEGLRIEIGSSAPVYLRARIGKNAYIKVSLSGTSVYIELSGKEDEHCRACSAEEMIDVIRKHSSQKVA
ncbi:MAG: hypothetical protein HGB03_01905 [Candidatus Yonathbacteria bacterium]|nr:hypothetical protein [Candidatus Yonathbacteria bacterium]NTW48013.1 hypothetical protein [Candidatus Yonathbacteria bacterium]